MPKQVTLKSGRAFKTVVSAKAHFSGLREKTQISDILPEPHKSDAIDVYRRYCEAAGWAPIEAIDVTVIWDSEKRHAGTYARTRAFAVVGPSGATSVFSMDKALRAIAR